MAPLLGTVTDGDCTDVPAGNVGVEQLIGLPLWSAAHSEQFRELLFVALIATEWLP